MLSDDNEKLNESTPRALPAESVETARELLEHLYDLPFLQQHLLARHPAIVSQGANEAPSQALRAALLGAIDALQPPPGHASGSQLARAYNVVYLHYVDGMTVHEASHQLGISLRQAYRDLQRGVDSVTALLLERLKTAETTPELAGVHQEVERLLPRPAMTELAELLVNALRAVNALATQKNVDITFAPPASPVTVSTDRSVAQQVLVHLLSGIVQLGQPEQIRLGLAQAADGTTEITAVCQRPHPPLESAFMDGVTRQLADKLHWSIQLESARAGAQVVRLTMPRASWLLLVIDDNEGLVDLLDRYLDGTDTRVTAATHPLEGLRLCQELQPQAVLLDVMMPDIDGWELLQRLRNNPRTSEISVIICTVFNDPELAFSLGAARFLPKPVDRAAFLAVLQSLRSTE